MAIKLKYIFDFFLAHTTGGEIHMVVHKSIYTYLVTTNLFLHILLAVILTAIQSKAYARDQGRPITWRDEDRGYVSLRYSYWITEGISDTCKFDTLQTTRILLLVLYLSLNLLVPVLLAKFGATCYRKASQSMLASTPTFLMCWAVVIVIVLYNTLNIIGSMFVYMEYKAKLYFMARNTSLYSDGMAAFGARITLFPLVYTLELLIAAHIPKDTGLPIYLLSFKGCFSAVCVPPAAFNPRSFRH